MMVLHHPFDIQIFHCNLIISLDDLICRLVKEVPPLICHLLMLARKYAASFSAIRAVALLLAQLALGYLQIPFCLSEILRVLYKLACAESGEVLYPYVNTNGVAGLWNKRPMAFFDC